MPPAGWSWLLVPAAGVITLLVTPVLRKYLVGRGMVDLPDTRRSHQVPTPRGGGLAMLAGLLPVLLILAWFDDSIIILTVFVSALALVGWLDDRMDLPIMLRMGVQGALAVLLLWSVRGIDSLALGSYVLDAPVLLTVLAFLAVVWLINLHNFMDGADGLASTQGAWSGLLFGVIFLRAGQSVLALACFAVSTVCLGFLVWNRPPARLFMGDTGSLLIGGVVAWMVVVSFAVADVSPWVSLILTSVFVVDTTLTLVRRVSRGERWYTPHRQHAYQRLIASGWGHGQVLRLYAGANLLIVLPAAWAALRFPQLDAWLAAFLLALLTMLWSKIQAATNGVQTTA